MDFADHSCIWIKGECDGDDRAKTPSLSSCVHVYTSSPAALPKLCMIFPVTKAPSQEWHYSSVEGNLRSVIAFASVVFHYAAVHCELFAAYRHRCRQDSRGQSPFYQYIQAYYLVGEMVRVRMEYGDGLEDTSSSSSYSVATGAVHLSSKSANILCSFSRCFDTDHTRRTMSKLRSGAPII